MEITRSSKQGFTGVTSIFVYSSSQDQFLKLRRELRVVNFNSLN